jgi:hypothetical protein
MKRFVSKMIIAAALVLIAGGSIFAASAKVTYVKGKVEVNRSNEWVALKVGDVVNEAETISTGFQSEARLNFNGSVMAVPALSRITLETLQSSGSKETVSLKVDTGAVRSRVTHTEGKRIEYSARTSVAVASVRGTDFAVFANGRAKVFSGAIAYYKAADFIVPIASPVVDAEEEPKTDEGPAASTTPANEIVDNAPKGTMVVGAGQSSTIGKSGLASKPIVEAKKMFTKAKTAVAPASAKEVLSAGLASAGAASLDTASVGLGAGDEAGSKPVKKTEAVIEVDVSIKNTTSEKE